MQLPLTCLDLFCGAGGLSLGFTRAGFQIVCAIDSSSPAVLTHRANLMDRVAQHDLSRSIELPQATVIIGGPPCQGFSSAGMRLPDDRRNSLVSRFAHIVARCRPMAFVFENVEGFLTSSQGDRVLDLLAPLIAVGYRIHVRKVNAANYGVPQHRKRTIAIGTLGWDPSFPPPTHAAYGAPGARLAGSHLPLAPTTLEALGGLPVPTTEEPGCPPDHFYRPLQGVDLERARALRPGQRMRDLPVDLWHESYRRRAYRRVRDGTPTERRGGAPAGVRRLRGDEPSKAITSGARTEFLHPVEDRNLTLRECARLQTFPDEYTFVGSPSDKAQLIGDAVPPLLAFAIARNLASDLRAAEPMYREGALLSFVPTLSEGMSPALQTTTDRVLQSFQRHARSAEQLVLWP
ncbi:MAG: DNA cytosine methyltransferase [Chloroflexi bacterium]|nr:DNA cytosine methyltransferase [Chloroflexota bacterium]